MPEVNFVDIDKRLAALQGQVVRIKRAPLFSKAPLVESAVEDLLALLVLMVAEIKAAPNVRITECVFCNLDLIVPLDPAIEAKCPKCRRKIYP